jgi:hypothetical protein
MTHIDIEIPDSSSYAQTFERGNPYWHQDPALSEYFLLAVQSAINDTLYLKGYVLLNDVYKMLGFAEIPEGAIVGWSNKSSGDEFISFGIDNDINQENGNNRWVLNFNVNGVIFKDIGTKEI